MKKIYLIPHFHYDVAWAFTKEDYLNIAELILKKTLKMIEEQDFSFLIEQTYLLEQIEHTDPDLFSDIEKAISRGKLEIVDGQYIMADPMIPGGEVLVREILFGKLYAKEKFNVDVPVVWAADGFGLNAQLPQIYKKSGYQWMAFRRGMPKAIGERTSEFVWEGLDGSRILAHWMPLGYRAGLEFNKWEENSEKLFKLASTENIMMPCGSGGIPPQEDITEKVDAWNHDHRDVEMVIKTPISYFQALESSLAHELPVYKWQLYSGDLESIFPDVVSSRISLKLAFREIENLLMLTERIAALAYLFGREYPDEVLTDLWKKMLFLAMHDIMPSCGIDEIYEDAWAYIHEMKKELPEVIRKSARHMIKSGKPAPGIVVFNTNSWAVTDWVEADVTLGAGWEREPGLMDNTNKEIASESVRVEKWDDGSIEKARIGFMAKVPPMGYRFYRLAEKKRRFRSKTKVFDNEVENRFFKLRIEPKTGILHVFDKANEKILEGNEVIIDEEIGDLYFHMGNANEIIGSESGEGNRFGAFRPEGLSIEKGAIRTVMKYKSSFYTLRWPYYLKEKYDPVLYRHKSIDICKKIIIYEAVPRIDFVTTLDVKQSHIRIRLGFDTCMPTPQYTRQTQFGALPLSSARAVDETIKTPSLAWLNCNDDHRGLAFLTKGVPVNEIIHGKIFYTLLRSVSVLSADGVSGPLIPTPGAMELGKHTYIYSVYPHSGSWQDAGIPRKGAEMSQSLEAFQVETAPPHAQFASIRIEPENLILSALKKSEHDDTLILRFFESEGEVCTAVIELPEKIKQVQAVDLLESNPQPVDFNDNKVKFPVDPFEIVTLKLHF